MFSNTIPDMDYKLILPDEKNSIKPGNIVQLGRFSTQKWVVRYGWFSFEGNRSMCMWYLENLKDSTIQKPLQNTDLYDIYLIEV